jgi:hypothetical protein
MEQNRCYARGGAAGSSLLASTVVELPESRPNGTPDDADLLRYCTRQRAAHIGF